MTVERKLDDLLTDFKTRLEKPSLTMTMNRAQVEKAVEHWLRHEIISYGTKKVLVVTHTPSGAVASLHDAPAEKVEK